mmetsp:Transcript_15749/g.45008  ORF Transcript_15749/g.45008 Transcript_15749/m.45008 type:complete len:212 (+) Transcript_15749:1416-2051(+)
MQCLSNAMQPNAGDDHRVDVWKTLRRRMSSLPLSNSLLSLHLSHAPSKPQYRPVGRQILGDELITIRLDLVLVHDDVITTFVLDQFHKLFELGQHGDVKVAHEILVRAARLQEGVKLLVPEQPQRLAGQQRFVQRQQHVQVLGPGPRHEHRAKTAILLVNTERRRVLLLPPIRVGGKIVCIGDGTRESTSNRKCLANDRPLRLAAKPLVSL